MQNSTVIATSTSLVKVDPVWQPGLKYNQIWVSNTVVVNLNINTKPAPRPNRSTTHILGQCKLAVDSKKTFPFENLSRGKWQ